MDIDPKLYPAIIAGLIKKIDQKDFLLEKKEEESAERVYNVIKVYKEREIEFINSDTDEKLLKLKELNKNLIYENEALKDEYNSQEKIEGIEKSYKQEWVLRGRKIERLKKEARNFTYEDKTLKKEKDILEIKMNNLRHDNNILRQEVLRVEEILSQYKEYPELKEEFKNFQKNRPLTKKITALTKENTRLREKLFLKPKDIQKRDWSLQGGQKNRFYVYIWYNDKDQPFYIGKGSGDRAYQIVGKRNYNFIRIYNSQKNPKVTLICQYLTENQAFHLEEVLIKIFKKKFELTNVIYNGINLDNRIELPD